MDAASGQLNRPLRTEAEALRDLATRDAEDPAWRFRHDRQINGNALETFRLRTRHLRTGGGKPLESIQLKLQGEREPLVFKPRSTATAPS